MAGSPVAPRGFKVFSTRFDKVVHAKVLDVIFVPFGCIYSLYSHRHQDTDTDIDTDTDRQTDTHAERERERETHALTHTPRVELVLLSRAVTNSV